MASSGHFVWAVDGKPVSVHLGADAVRTLESCLFAPSPGRQNETGGFLLGRVRQVNDSWMVAVDAIEFSACEHARGASWTLSRADREAFGRQMGRLSRRGVVGWFRTHTRPGLYLDQHDFSLFRDFFPHPAAIVLLVRPDAQAGFFFWENGDVERSRPYATFTCRAGALNFGPQPVRDFVLPAPVTAAHRLRKGLLWIPAAAGIAIAALWSPPVPFQAPAEPVESATSVERPVFGVRPAQEREKSRLQPAIAVDPAPASHEPKPSPMQSRASRVARPASPPPPSATKQRQAPVVATLDAPKPNILKRTAGHIPGLGFLKKPRTAGLDTPARVVRQVRPSRFEDTNPVRVKVRIDKDGYVRSAHLLTNSASAPTAQSVMRAARGWRFAPARQANRPVESEMVLTFQPDHGGGSTP